MVDLAMRSLLHDKLRFLITVVGVAFAVTLVFVQVGLFLGLMDNASVMIEHLDADLWVTSHDTMNIDFAHAFSDSYVHRVRSIDGVERADNLIVQFMNVRLPSGAEEALEVYALEDFRRWDFPWSVTAGNVDDLRRGKFMMLDESSRKRFGDFKVGEHREILGQRLRIIGTTQGAESFTTTPITFVDFHLAQAMGADLVGKSTYILVKTAPGAGIEKVRAEIRRRLPYNDVYTKREWIERSRSYWVISTGLGLNMYLTVFLGCLVGVVVVAQTLYTSTMEHFREFGTVKAIGGSNADIYKILCKQASIAAVVGYALGAAQAYALQPLISRIELKLIIPPAFAAWVFAGALVMCLASALVSFRKVASIDPALVFRT